MTSTMHYWKCPRCQESKNLYVLRSGMIEVFACSKCNAYRDKNHETGETVVGEDQTVSNLVETSGEALCP